MRKQLVKTVLEVMEKDIRVVLFLGDIGVYGFREAFERFPDRIFNIGILEQASVSAAAGLAIEGLIPIFHSIAPFVVERCLEQIKVDFGYQQLGGNFISVGASYDYSNLGCTHMCPGDVQVLKTIPGMEIVVPGHPLEFDELFQAMYANKRPTYFRLSERYNTQGYVPHDFKSGSSGTVIAIGPMLDRVVEACDGLDVSILYDNNVGPLDGWNLWEGENRNIIVVEPFYEGTLVYDVQEMTDMSNILSIGVPRRFLTSYGTPEELDKECSLTASQIRDRIREFLNI